MTDKVQGAVPADDPMMIAWNSYRESGEFANTRKWAALDEHLDGSLWAAFVEGWQAAKAIASPPLSAEER